jgi:hypothetical protein
LTIAQCRVNDTACPISKQLAAEIVKKVLEQQTAPTAAAAPPASNQ